ncbi:TIM barrel protein [Metabacillus sp. Hm71]|uniref:TIM barrel protein n=1 Tax=Metabacillus sp. Hm71 TaxID=3450743 RepID=UPI003F432C42
MKFSVVIESVYLGKDFIQSMREVKHLGFSAFEFWSWWDKDLQAIMVAKEAFHLQLSSIVTKFISLTDPAKRQEYVRGVRQTIGVAKMLGCSTIVSQVGQELPAISRREQHRSIVDGLRACVPFLKQSGITLVIEPLNTIVDHKGYYLDSAKEGFHIVEEVGSPYVKVLYDIYHMQIMEGNIISTITENIEKIGHFHVAGVPGRHEPYIGELYYINILKAIEET